MKKIIRLCNFLKDGLKTAEEKKKSLKFKKAEDTKRILTHPGHLETTGNKNFYKHARKKRGRNTKVIDKNIYRQF